MSTWARIVGFGVGFWIILLIFDEGIRDFIIPIFDNGGNPEEARQIDALAIWKAYQANETLADKQYKGEWFLVRLKNIEKIESDGVVKKRVDTSYDYVILDFRDDDDVLELRPGRDVEAFCKLSGSKWGDVQFKYCRWP